MRGQPTGADESFSGWQSTKVAEAITMRFVIAAMLVSHGLIHLLGFLKPWKLAEVPQLRETTGRFVGTLWLLAALLLVTAAVLRVLERETWWIPGALGVVLSQGLIFFQWTDAKAGTIANVLLALPLVIAFSIDRFHETNEVQLKALLASAPQVAPSIVTMDELTRLPPPVKRWLESSGAVGRPRARTVEVIQRGEMRTSPAGAFMHAEARQAFTVDQPAFVWTVDVTMFGVPVVGRDSFLDGKARMLIKAGGLITVADGTGEKFDQGTLLRFLGEIVWFPSAALAPYIHWEGIDERQARATITWKGTTASAVFEIDERGRVTGLFAQRYFDGSKTLEAWAIPMTEWKTIRGIEMPTKGTAVWRLAAGDFEYYRWEIADVETNKSLISKPFQIAGLQLDQLVH